MFKAANGKKSHFLGLQFFAGLHLLKMEQSGKSW